MRKAMRRSDPNLPPSADSWLLTPGPLSTAPSVKRAMLRDWGSRDREFREITAEIVQRLLAIVDGSDRDHACVPVQGSGTYAVEAMLGTFVPAAGKVLVLANGAYGERMAEILRYIGRQHSVLTTDDCLPLRVDAVERALATDRSVSHVAIVHLETSSGILNPIAEIADAVHRNGRKLLVDAMSSFGALPTGAGDFPWTALAASANKCLEGVPGIGLVIARRSELEASDGQSHSLCLDLHAQWEYLQKTGQWRFTPPTHVAAAFLEALRRHETEGGVAARGSRYSDNRDILIDGMRGLGFEPLIPEPWRSPVIAAFHMPSDPSFAFAEFYDRLKEKGFTIYPGKLTSADSFRVGCIGVVDANVMREFVDAARFVLDEMGIRNLHAPIPSRTARAC